MKECTFKPNIIQKKAQTPVNKSSSQRGVNMYEEHRIRQSQKRVNQSNKD